MKTLSFLAILTLAVASARAQSDSPAIRAGELPEVDHMVYLTFMPEPSDLTQDAAANGLTILRLDRTADRIIVSYKYPDGHTATLGYAKLSEAGNRDEVRPARRVAKVVTPEPEVVYYEPGYRTRYVYSDPVDNFWVPLTLGIGLGWATSWHGGHGGYYHGHGGWRH